MIHPLHPFASYDYAMEMDNDVRTVTVHRISGPCRPPRNGFLAKMMRRFRDIKEPPEWIETPSPEETRVAMDGLNAAIARTFGGVLPPYKFNECPCTRVVRQALERNPDRAIPVRTLFTRAEVKELEDRARQGESLNR